MYVKVEKNYQLLEGVQCVWKGPKVALAIRESSGMLVDHGDPSKIEALVANSVGLISIAGEFPTSVLNHVVAFPFAAGTYLRRMQALACTSLQLA